MAATKSGRIRMAMRERTVLWMGGKGQLRARWEEKYTTGMCEHKYIAAKPKTRAAEPRAKSQKAQTRDNIGISLP